MNSKIKIIFVALVLSALVFSAGCPSDGDNSGQDGGGPAPPLEVSLSLSDKPLLNTQVTLTMTIISIMDASNASANFHIPDGFELVSGNLEWQGNLTTNEEKTIEVIVKSIAIGYHQLEGECQFLRDGDMMVADSDILYVEVMEDDAIIGSRPENNWYDSLSQGDTVPMPENNEQIESELLIDPAPALNGEFTVTYRVTPLINLQDPERTQISLVFPPNAFEIIGVQFPEGGTTYQFDEQLSWKGTINANQTVEVNVTFRVINTGSGFVYGNLNVQPSGEITDLIQETTLAELYVNEYEGSFTVRELPEGKLVRTG